MLGFRVDVVLCSKQALQDRGKVVKRVFGCRALVDLVGGKC